MITSSSISYISKVLDRPQDISDADLESIEQLTTEFPYFVPARYLDAARKHKLSPYSDEMMSSMQLYTGNWLQYCQFLQNSVDGELLEYEFKSPDDTSLASTETQVEANSVVSEELQIEEQTEAVTKEEPTAIVEQAIAEAETQENADEVDLAGIEEESTTKDRKKDTLIPPVYTEDYFLHQGFNVSNNIPSDIGQQKDDTSLMVVMSFSEWLSHYKKKKKEEEEEENDQKELKTMWQKQKLAAALEEGNEEIPETVFEMAVNSISKEENLASESLAEVYVKQERYDKAIDMYKKLSLSKPQKKAYFARRIEEILNLSNT